MKVELHCYETNKSEFFIVILVGKCETASLEFIVDIDMVEEW